MNNEQNDFFGKQLAITHHRLFQLFSKAFHKEGYSLTFEQSILMKLINENEGVSQQDLSVLMNRDKTSMARAINHLEDKGLVVRIPSKEDKRKKIIYLTKEGRRHLEEIFPKFLDIKNKVESCLNDEEIASLRSLLTKIENQINKIEETL